MAKQKKTRRRPRERTTARQQQRERAQLGTVGFGAALAAVPDGLLHSQAPAERPWKFLLPVLALAFAVRAAIALAGDFVLHPDEIMQYLEPAHRLVFGNGVIYWEYFYGARSWLVPGAVAAVLKLFDVVGLGEPFWYVGGVKLFFCALSLAVPAGMYVFARRHFNEMAARAALLAGAFWYELVGFAHKPMTEFVATGLLMVLLALCIHPAPNRPRTVWLAAFLAILAVAIRVQYAPLVLVLLGLVFLRTEKKWQMTVAATAFFLATGLFDMVTWNLAAGSFGEAAWERGLFHSYLTNIRVNFALGESWQVIHPAWQYLLWLLYAGAGLTLLCAAGALREPRRYGLLLSLIALGLLLHSLQTHKEYRFIFVVIPLWLLIGADLAVRFATGSSRRHLWFGTVIAVVAAVSLAGILEALPRQNRSYQGVYVRPPERLGFVGGEDPVFAVYRYLARTPGVTAVAHPDHPYFGTPGYYYLHRSIPFYDNKTLDLVPKDLPAFSASVSHVVSANPGLALPGYSVEKEFGNIRIWRREDGKVQTRQWRRYVPVIDSNYAQVLRRLDPEAAAIPPDSGIQFADEGQPESDS